MVLSMNTGTSAEYLESMPLYKLHEYIKIYVEQMERREAAVKAAQAKRRK